MTSPESQNKDNVTENAMAINEFINEKTKKESGISMLGLMKEDLKHRKWMLVISSVVQFLAGPVIVLFWLTTLKKNAVYLSSYDPEMIGMIRQSSMAFFHEIISEYIPMMQIVIAVCGALITGIGGYRHLFNRRMTDMVNSLPLKREKQFAVIYLNGFLIWFVPFLVSLAISIAICLIRAYGWGIGGEIALCGLYIIAGSTLCFVACYNLIILAVSLSGTIFNALVNIAFIGFDLILGYTILYVLCEHFYSNFSRLAVDFQDVMWLSTPVSSCVCSFIISSAQKIGDFLDKSIFAFTLAMTIVISVLNLVLALIIYSKRKSEESESGVSNKPYRFLIRTINSIYAGLLIVFIVMALLPSRYGSGAVWMVFFAVVFSVLAFGLIDSAHGKTFKAFFSHWKQMIATAAATVLILVVFINDLTGYDNRIVSRSNLNGAIIRYDIDFRNDSSVDYLPVPGMEGYIRYRGNNVISFYEARNTEVSPELAYRIITADKMYWKAGGGYVYDPVDKKIVKTWSYEDSAEERPYYDHLYIEADRKVGPDFCRYYNIADPDVINDLIMSEGFKEKYFKLECGELGYPESMKINVGGYDGENYVIPDEYIPMIMEAYYSDFENNYSVEYLDEPKNQVVLQLRYRSYYSEDDLLNDRYSTSNISVYPIEDDTRTMAVLEELVRSGVIDWYTWEARNNPDLNDWVTYYEDYELYD